ncbi:thioredoxin-like protein [Scleroderma citrinum]
MSTLVGEQFEEVIFDDSKDVFVEFYVPWCCHCKYLKPTWDSLDDHFVDVKDQLNDLPASASFSISSFPTLKSKPAGSHDFIDYNGDHLLESLITFVEEKAKNNLIPKVKAPEQEAQAMFAKPGEGHDKL